MRAQPLCRGLVALLAVCAAAACAPAQHPRADLAEAMRTLFIVSASTVVILCLMIWLLLRRIARPAQALESWAAALDQPKLKTPPPDFCYPELNRLAELIRNSLIAEHLTLERERLFLQYSSHELRTPISVVLAATELLCKIQQGRGEGHAQKAPSTVDQHPFQPPARDNRIFTKGPAQAGRCGHSPGQPKRASGRG